MIDAVTDMNHSAGADAAALSAQRHLERGEPLSAYNEAHEALALSPGHLRLRQLQALALARSGDTHRANVLLQELASEGMDDSETLGMLARTHKDLGLAAKDAAGRATHLEAAFKLYQRGYDSARASGDAQGAWYAGINAATLALLRDDREQARLLAAAVHAICAARDDGREDYWRAATLGEAALILGDPDSAASHYMRATAAARGRFGDIASTRRQVKAILAHLPQPPAALLATLTVPPVVIFTGNMIDAADRNVARFPASLEGEVQDLLHGALRSIAPVAVYASAACGSDILCLEAARDLGAETHIVLPFPAAEFRSVSVDFAGADWGKRFDRVLAAATSVTITSDHYASGSAATFEYANLILTGSGQLRAHVLDTSLLALAVCEEEANPRPGGAAALVTQWRRAGLDIERIDLAAARGSSADAGSPIVAPPSSPGIARHELRAMLFADAVGYSKLVEDQIPGYIEGFLGAVAELARTTAHRHEHVEVAGDGLYMVFADVAGAGRFALELSALANRFDRAAWRLPANFNLRIALHCGPVHCAREPITGGRLYTGPHTSRAARIEPVTPPGQVYVSSAFAAIAAASGCDFAMNYVGRMPLAKGYGALGLHHLRGES